MATARPPGGGSTPQARLGIDLSSFQRAPAVAREAGQATAREISNAFKAVQAEQRVALEQARQTTAAVRAQQNQISAVTRAESSVRIAAARAEGVAQQQAARSAAATVIEQQKRITATHRAEIRAREAAERADRASAGGGGQFLGAALGGIGGPVGALAGGLAAGSPALAAGLAVGQAARFTFESSQLSVAYGRQRLAAENLAGSTATLNAMMEAYTRASGGAVAKTSALANVTRLQAVGFGDSAAEVERFTVAVRGASIAMGTAQDQMSQEVQLAISNQSLRRLDQIGLGITEVNDRIAQLRAQNQGMTREAAFQEAILGLLTEKFGALAESAEGQATGVEQLSAAWKDFGLAAGEATTPVINFMASGISNWLKDTQRDVGLLTDAWNELNIAMRGGTGPGGRLTPITEAQLAELQRGPAAGTPSWLRGGATAEELAPLRAERETLRIRHEALQQAFAEVQQITDRDVSPALERMRFDLDNLSQSIALLDQRIAMAGGGGAPAPPMGAQIRPPGTPDPPFRAVPLEPDQVAALRAREEGFAAIERESARARLEATQTYERQRASTIANYEKQIAREAEDFGRQRANAERKLQMSILDVHQDSARQRAKWEADLERNIAQARADSAEKAAEWESDRAERIAEMRSDSAEREAEIEEKYAKNREKAAEDHRERLMQAAGRLDAVAVREEQREYARAARDAEEAHKERIDEEGESLQEGIDEANKAHAKRLDDEADALAKSERQANDAHQRRLDEQKENDRLRIDEMKDAFEEQKIQEDIERGIRLARQAEDHQDQLDEMGRAHGERIQQIKDHAQEERDQFTEESNAFLEDVGIHNQAWLDEQERINEGVIKRHEELLEAERRALLNRMGQPPGFPSLADPFQHVPPVPSVSQSSTPTSSRSVSIGDVTVQVLGSTNMDESQLYDVVYSAIANVMEDA